MMMLKEPMPRKKAKGSVIFRSKNEERQTKKPKPAKRIQIPSQPNLLQKEPRQSLYVHMSDSGAQCRWQGGCQAIRLLERRERK